MLLSDWLSGSTFVQPCHEGFRTNGRIPTTTNQDGTCLIGLTRTDVTSRNAILHDLVSMPTDFLIQDHPHTSEEVVCCALGPTGVDLPTSDIIHTLHPPQGVEEVFMEQIDPFIHSYLMILLWFCKTTCLQGNSTQHTAIPRQLFQ